MTAKNKRKRLAARREFYDQKLSSDKTGAYRAKVNIKAMLRLADAIDNPQRARRWRWWMRFLP